MSEQFAGWAVIELFGHAKEVGYVTTQYFGDKAMFQVDVPSLPDGEERAIERPQWLDGELLPAGSIVKTKGVPGRTRLIGPGAVYSINPCTEEVARVQLERNCPREYQVVALGVAKLPAVIVDTYEPRLDDEELDDENTGPF